MERVIFHCDLNSFYASVELLDHPDRRELPAAVCGDPPQPPRHHPGQERAGQGPAASRPPRPSGRHSAKCPDLVLLPPHRDRYRPLFPDHQRRSTADCTDRVEPFGIDESWLDVTGILAPLRPGDPGDLADRLRAQVRRGHRPHRLGGGELQQGLRKAGQRLQKAGRHHRHLPGKLAGRIVWPLPVADLLVCGQRGRPQPLLQYGIRTIGHLAACPRSTLESLMGKLGGQLSDYANGLDTAPVRARQDAEPVESVGNGITFPQNLTTRQQVYSGIAVLADTVATRLGGRGCTPAASPLASGVRLGEATAPARRRCPPPPTSSGT